MLINILLIFIFWTLPCIIFYVAPFGADPSAMLTEIVIGTNVAMYTPCILWLVISNNKIRINKGKFEKRQVNIILQAMILVINLFIIQSVGFTLGILDDSIRTTVYNNAGVFWSLLVALYSISFALLGMDMGASRANKYVKKLSLLNSVIFFSYGMKAGIVQIILSFMAGWFAVSDKNSKEKYIRNLAIMLVAIFLGFWAINSLRAKELIHINDFINLIYLYIAPNFQNFSNILGIEFEYNYFLGGVFGGLYKVFIPGYYDPLVILSLEYLEHQTWNVWSYLSTFYISGNLFEIFFGSFLIGLYTTASLIWYKKYRTLLSVVNISQVLLLLLFLHNQYYYSSFAPYLSIGLAWFIGIFFVRRKGKWKLYKSRIAHE